MNDKDVIKLLDEQHDWIVKEESLIIALYITKHKGKALYYNSEDGCIKAGDIDFRDTHKFETNNFKLMRFNPAYIQAAKAVAITYMQHNSCGYAVYSENGIYAG